MFKRTATRLMPIRWLVAAAFAASLLSCGGGRGDGEGGDCQVCRSTKPECDTGLTCQRFQGNFTYALCAKPATTSCEVPY